MTPSRPSAHGLLTYRSRDLRVIAETRSNNRPLPRDLQSPEERLSCELQSCGFGLCPARAAYGKLSSGATARSRDRNSDGHARRSCSQPGCVRYCSTARLIHRTMATCIRSQYSSRFRVRTGSGGQLVAGEHRELNGVPVQEDVQAAKEKAHQVAAKLGEMRLARAAEIVESGIDERLTYYAMPAEHWRSLRTNNSVERLMRFIECRRRRLLQRCSIPDSRNTGAGSAAPHSPGRSSPEPRPEARSLPRTRRPS